VPTPISRHFLDSIAPSFQQLFSRAVPWCRPGGNSYAEGLSALFGGAQHHLARLPLEGFHGRRYAVTFTLRFVCPKGNGGSSDATNCVASVTQRDQVVLRIIAALAAKILVMKLPGGSGPATLGISSHHGRSTWARSRMYTNSLSAAYCTIGSRGLLRSFMQKGPPLFAW